MKHTWAVVFIIVLKARVSLITLTTALIIKLSKCGSEPACTIKGCWDQISSEELSHHSVYHLHLFFFPTVTSYKNVLWRPQDQLRHHPQTQKHSKWPRAVKSAPTCHIKNDKNQRQVDFNCHRLCFLGNKTSCHSWDVALIFPLIIQNFCSSQKKKKIIALGTNTK